MLFKKLTIAGCLVLSLGIAAVGGGRLLVRASRAQETKTATPGTSSQAAKTADPVEAKPVGIDPLLQELLDAARKRVDAQKAYYEEGRITLDRFVDALAHLENVQLIASNSEAERKDIRQRHVNLLKEVENREQAEVQVGRGTEADVSEAHQRRLEAEYAMKTSEQEAAEKSAILRRLSELERKVDQLEKDRTDKPAGKP